MGNIRSKNGRDEPYYESRYECTTEGCSRGDCDNCVEVMRLRKDAARLAYALRCPVTFRAVAQEKCYDAESVRRELDLLAGIDPEFGRPVSKWANVKFVPLEEPGEVDF